MKKLILLFMVLFALIFGATIVRNYSKTGKLPFLNSKNSKKTAAATINGHNFNLLLAKTSAEKEIGLSKRDSLPKDFGMLFLFDSAGNYAFWAKDMRFPIDIIFINNDKIVTIYKNVKPQKDQNNLPVFGPKEISNLVLEINSGLSDKYNIREGDTVKFENLQ